MEPNPYYPQRHRGSSAEVVVGVAGQAGAAVFPDLAGAPERVVAGGGVKAVGPAGAGAVAGGVVLVGDGLAAGGAAAQAGFNNFALLNFVLKYYEYRFDNPRLVLMAATLHEPTAAGIISTEDRAFFAALGEGIASYARPTT